MYLHFLFRGCRMLSISQETALESRTHVSERSLERTGHLGVSTFVNSRRRSGSHLPQQQFALYAPKFLDLCTPIVRVYARTDNTGVGSNIKQESPPRKINNLRRGFGH